MEEDEEMLEKDKHWNKIPRNKKSCIQFTSSEKFVLVFIIDQYERVEVLS